LSKRGFDRIFKELAKWFFKDYAKHIKTDYELLKFPRKADVLLIEIDEQKVRQLKIFNYLRHWNGIEFKSENDSFGRDDLYKIGIYIGGILLQEKIKQLEDFTWTVITTLKPVKLFGKYHDKVDRITEGVYCIRDIQIVPVYWIVIDELPRKFEKEYKWLMEFSVGEKRKTFLKEILTNFKNDENNDLIKYAMPLYKDEMEEIIKKEGIPMTLVEKNIFNWANELGILEKAKNEGKEKNKEEGARENSLETAKRMLEDNLPIIDIAKYTGLSVTEIKKIK